MKEQHARLIKETLVSSQPPAIAFDGCHKIYILLDNEQVRQSEDGGYNEDGSSMIYLKDTTVEDMFSTLDKWYNESCSLRFIHSVRTVESNPNDGYVNLIPQFEDDEDFE